MAAVIGCGVGKLIERVDADPGNLGLYSVRCMAVGTIVDMVVVPTLIVIGILGSLSILPFSPAASHAMIGAGALCALPHIMISVMIASITKIFSDRPNLNHYSILFRAAE